MVIERGLKFSRLLSILSFVIILHIG